MKTTLVSTSEGYVLTPFGDDTASAVPWAEIIGAAGQIGSSLINAFAPKPPTAVAANPSTSSGSPATATDPALLMLLARQNQPSKSFSDDPNFIYYLGGGAAFFLLVTLLATRK